MAESDRKRLLDRAMALPMATPSDFSGDRKPPHDVKAELLKKIDDTSLRSRLIAVGLAEGLQSPKGPQKIASILRIYPAFDAPPKPPRVPRGPRRQSSLGALRGQRGGGGVRPTIDQMESLISRIRAEEAAVAHAMHADIDEEIRKLQQAFGTLDGSDLERAHQELGEALSRKRESAAHIRGEAFRRIERDAEFPPRIFLRLLAG